MNWRINILFFNFQNSIPEATECYIFYITQQIHQINNILYDKYDKKNLFFYENWRKNLFIINWRLNIPFFLI